MASYRLFPSTDGPSSLVSYSGAFICGVAFTVTTGGTWFGGYWWWVCPSGQSALPQQSALWAPYASAQGALVPGSVVTSDPLSEGWNYVPLARPVPITIGAAYIAATGVNGSFPSTVHCFGSGDPYSAGIANGPLTGYSDQSGSLPAPFSVDQGSFTTAGSDPAGIMPAYGSQSCNFWIDIEVTDTAPAGASHRLWPGYPVIPPTANADDLEQTMGTEFLLSAPCTLDNIWFYSPAGSTQLPTRCAVWDVATETEVTGTDNPSPSWSGAAGNGWVACGYSGIVLPPGGYKVAVYTPGGSVNFYQETESYFGGGGQASVAGIVSGPLSAPNLANATGPGQCTYQHGGWLYPDTYDTVFDGQNRWVDVEVTPAGTAVGSLPIIFFP
jgi:hypothetical protein